MNEAEFRAKAAGAGFSDFQVKDYASEVDGPLHTHEFSVTLLVTAGEFALQYEDRRAAFGIGEVCDLPAGVVHAERAGPDGAVILLAKKAHRVAP